MKILKERIGKKMNKIKNCVATNTPLIYYRVDTRIFSCGCEIRTAGEYYEKYGNKLKYIDDILEEKRPENKKNRRNCLFLFEDKKRAQYYWSELPNGKLYEVSINADQILHRGDMNLMDCMMNCMDILTEHEIIPSYQDYNIYKNKMSCCIAKSDAEKKTNIAKKMSEIAKKYWLGGESKEPNIEILVGSAVITKVISTCDKERSDYAKYLFEKRYKSRI